MQFISFEINIHDTISFPFNIENPMIKKIVRDPKNYVFEPSDKISEKLNYFKELSKKGLENFSALELETISSEFISFLNIDLAFFADSYPTKLFRITNNKYLYSGKSVKLQKISDLIGPPKEYANVGRANMKGESVFYAALDFNTAVWETQPEVGDYITLSEWRIKEGEKLYNHFVFHSEETNLSRESQNAFNAYIEQIGNVRGDLRSVFKDILNFFAEEFMKPVRREFGENYLFSSLISSRFLQHGKDSNGFQIESITYPSTRRDCEVTNIAILNSLVFEKLELISAKTMYVADTNYDLQNKNRGDLIKISSLITEAERFDFENNTIHWNIKKELKDAMRLHAESEKINNGS